MAFKNPFEGMKRWQVIATVSGASLIGGYFVYRHHSETGSWNPWSGGSTSAGEQTGINPVTGLSYSDDNAVDPITGEQYLAEAQEFGSVAAAESSVSAFGQSTATGSGIPVNPASPQSAGTANPAVGSDIYTSNAAWSQAVTAGLVSIGYDGPTVAAAIGAYLTQTPVDPDQIKIINTAIAEYGRPPVGNLQVIPKPTASPSPTPSPQPKPTPKPAGVPSVSGGHVISVGTNRGVVGWTAQNASKYRVTITGPGRIDGQTNTISQKQASYSGLLSGHDYTVTVIPIGSDGTVGRSGKINMHTAPAGK